MATLQMALTGKAASIKSAGVKTVVAKGAMAGKAAMAVKGVGVTAGATKTAFGGAIISGKGLGLALGFGISTLAPVVLCAFGAITAYVFWKESQAIQNPTKD